MVKPQFRQLDVESMGRLYENKERKQKKLAQQKRQRERGGQQHQSRLPPTALPTPLEPDVGTPIATEAQTAGYTSAGFDNLCGINSFDFHFVGIDWGNEGNDIANTLGSFAPPSEIGGITTGTTKPISLDEINSLSEFWSLCPPQVAQPPTEQTSREETNALPEELPLVPDLAKCSTGQICATSCVISDLNTAPAEDKGRSENGNTCESCDDDGSANNDSSSSDEDLHGERCSREPAVSGSKPTSRDSAETTAPHSLPGSVPAAPDSTESSPGAASPIPSCSIDACATLSNSTMKLQTDVFSIPTPSSQVADAITSWGKRSHEVIEDGYESHDRRSPKRMRTQNICSGTASPAYPTRTLRSLPSPAFVGEPGEKDVTKQCDRQVRRSPRRRQQFHTVGAMPCSSDHSRPDRLPPISIANDSSGGKQTRRRRGRSPSTPQVTSPQTDHFSQRPSPHKFGLVSLSPVATTADPSSAKCHGCAFPAGLLEQITEAVQALSHVTKWLSHHARSSGPSDELNGKRIRRRPWKSSEKLRLRKCMRQGMPLQLIAEKLDRTKSGIKQQWKKMR